MHDYTFTQATLLDKLMQVKFMFTELEFVHCYISIHALL